MAAYLLTRNHEAFDNSLVVETDSWGSFIRDPRPLKEFIRQNIREAIAEHLINIQVIDFSSAAPEFLVELVRVNSCCLVKIPMEFWTQELVRASLENNLYPWLKNLFTQQQERYLANEFPSLLPLCVTVFSPAFIQLNDRPELFSDEFLKEIITASGSCLEFIEQDRITQEMCEIAVKTDPDIISCIPDQFKNFTVCKAALEWRVHNIEFIWDEEMLARLEEVEEFIYFIQHTRRSRVKVVREQVKHVGSEQIELAVIKGATCPISYEPITHENAIVTHCGHVFIREYLVAALRQTDNCPLCQAALC